MIAVMAALFAQDRATVPAMILAWGLSAYLSSFLGVAQSRVTPRTGGAFEWVTGHRDLAVRLGADFGINQGASNGANMAVGPVSYTHLDVYKRQVWRPWPRSVPG